MSFLDRYFAAVEPIIDETQMIAQMAELSAIEMPADFDSFERSTAHLQRLFGSIGLACEDTRFPADGRTSYQSFTAPLGFRTTRAVCAIVEPGGGLTVLGDRAVEPHTAIVGAGHTGPEGIEAEAVLIAAATDLLRTNIRGRIVFSPLHPMEIRSAVVAGGGRALVSAFCKRPRVNRAYVQWINTWDADADGWLPTARAARENLPGISLSPEHGDRLMARLARGPVTLRVVVEGGYFDGTMPALNAAAPGDEPGEILFTGHLFEPGLEDNASGAIVAFEASRVVQAIRDKLGRARLRRGVRHFHGQECYAVLALATFRPELLRRAFAHLNIDTVGSADGNPLALLPGLAATQGFSHFLMTRILAEAARRTGRPHTVSPHFGVNCTVIADPALGGVSTSAISQGATTHWHTSRDRAGTIALDPAGVRMAALASAAWLYALADGGTDIAGGLLEDYRREIGEALRAGTPVDTELFLDMKRREVGTLGPFANGADRGAVEAKIDALFDELARLDVPRRSLEPSGSKAVQCRCRSLVPRVLVGGPAVNGCFTAKALKRVGAPKWNGHHLILKSWADGARSLHEIARRAACETGREIPLDRVLVLFEEYANAGLVELKEA